MLTIRWTMDKDGRLTATFVRPKKVRPLSQTTDMPQTLVIRNRRTQTATTPQRAATGERAPEPEPMYQVVGVE
jgi:hypothetical protein